MFLAISERFNAPLERVPAVGDSLRDLQAAATVGARPILVLTGKGAKTRAAGNLPEGTEVYPDLAAVAQALSQ
jgi:D-glycero-D-manno-heptose 1,7-bisphosphate phosphatase